MKHQLSLLLSLSIIAQVACAQDFSFNNHLTVGLSESYFIYDSAAPNLENLSGQNITWDYSNTPGYGGQSRIIQTVIADSSAHFTDFPSSELALEIEGYLISYLVSNPQNLYSYGYVVEDTDLGDVKAKFHLDSQSLLTYPTAFSDSLKDNFAGNLSFTYNGNQQNPECTGVSSVSYDGFGNFVTPQGLSLNNVSRIRIIDTTFTSIPFFGDVQLVRQQFEYYQLDNSPKLPFFVHSNAKVMSGFPEPLININMVLGQHPTLGNVGLTEEIKLNVSVAPNPVNHQLKIISDTPIESAEIYDFSGRKMTIHRSNNTIITRDLKAGRYYLSVQTKGQIKRLPFTKL